MTCIIQPVIMITLLLPISGMATGADTIVMLKTALWGSSFTYDGKSLRTSVDFKQVMDRSSEAGLQLRNAESIKFPGSILAISGVSLFVLNVVQSMLVPQNRSSYSLPIAATGFTCLAGAIPFYLTYEVRLKRAVTLYNEEQRLGELSWSCGINKKAITGSLVCNLKEKRAQR